MKTMTSILRSYALLCTLTVIAGVLSGCATRGTPPPEISLGETPTVTAARILPEPPQPIEVVEVPKLLPLPAQLKSLGGNTDDKPPIESPDEKTRVARANHEARVAPSREGYVNAIQVWPYADGALYQVYTSPGRVTVIALQQGEELVTVSAGDTVRWIVGDTASGAGASLRVNILVKPTRVGIKTNLVVTTNRRTYLLELSSTTQAWMASASWDYPKDRLLSLQKQAQQAQTAAPIDTGLSLEQIKFRYAISGDSPLWKPLRAFDDGERVYIQFPGGITQGELPPLFVIGAQGAAQLVNYRFRSPYYIVNRLFGAAELRLGADKAAVVRIERTDGVGSERTGNAARRSSP